MIKAFSSLGLDEVSIRFRRRRDKVEVSKRQQNSTNSRNLHKTYVSYNGKSTEDGAVFLFIKTACQFDIRQEDIFNPTGKSAFVTESNPVTRTISKLDNETPKSVYARLLGVDEKTAEGMTFENPFGRSRGWHLHRHRRRGVSRTGQ